MCNISTPSKYKTKTIYKVVIKVNDAFPLSPSVTYLSAFTNQPVKVGLVSDVINLNELHYPYTDISARAYNKHMINRTSGFASLKTAKLLISKTIDKTKYTILKITIAGDVMKGTTDFIHYLPKHLKTYAGKEILSIEEIT